MVAAAVGAAGVASSIGGQIANSGGSGPAPDGSVTNTTSNAPWAAQQPYLLSGFQKAQDLFGGAGPQYYPGQTNAQFNPAQQYALNKIWGQAQQGEPITQTANNYAANLQNGAFFNNPASAAFGAIAQSAQNQPYVAAVNSGVDEGQNYLRNNAGMGALSPWASGKALDNPGTKYLEPWAQGQALNNPGTGYLQPLASGSASANNPANGALGWLSSGIPTSNLPGKGSLSSFANGDMLSAGNPYFSDLANSVGAQVIPRLQSSLIAGNNMSNPAGTYATSRGFADALMPYMEQNYNSGQDRMLQAGSTLGSQALQGMGVQAGAAGTMGSQFLGGQQLAGQAGQNIAQNYLTGAGQTQQAGQNIAQNYLTGAGITAQAAQNLAGDYINTGNSLAQNSINRGNFDLNAQTQGLQTQLAATQGISQNYQDTLRNMTQSLSTAPQIQGMNYADMNTMFGAGSAYQNQEQNNLNASQAAWNYNQNLPYQNLDRYMQTIQGNYGNQGSQTTPYFQNGTANALGTGLGAYQLGKGLVGNQNFGQMWNGSALQGWWNGVPSQDHYYSDPGGAYLAT